ncbi:Asparagine synthase (Glutamine-hydrolysing) [Methanoculleus bourgensis]|jgi:hypothetical protein|uniref:Asparagine synthase (Glutamine-hydrolysing) n=1 Tax=Methanoculleus bourgensis TaxID=83986 RepID=A0A0X3BPZ5_9EURY|nr:Asparagine synthase (Glutamine-hydrolysing) [Methanoculleus bourgensis]
MIQKYSEFAFPSLYVNFLDYVMRIKPKYRFDHALYSEWIENYVSIASKYPWEKTGVKITQGMLKRSPEKVAAVIVEKVRRDIFGDKTQTSMNPVDCWYNTNPELREVFETYLRKHIHILNEHPELLYPIFCEGTR